MRAPFSYVASSALFAVAVCKGASLANPCDNVCSGVVIVEEQPIYISQYFSSNTTINIQGLEININNAPTLFVSTATATSTLTVTTTTTTPGPNPTAPAVVSLPTPFLLFIVLAPATTNQRREQILHRQSSDSGFLVSGGSGTTSCTPDNLFNLQDGQLSNNGAFYSTSDSVASEPFQVSTNIGSISTTFSIANSVLSWNNPAFDGNTTRFCNDGSGILTAVFSGPLPPGCTQVILQLEPVGACPFVPTSTLSTSTTSSTPSVSSSDIASSLSSTTISIPTSSPSVSSSQVTSSSSSVVTSSPITSSPITSSPITSSPITSSPITSSATSSSIDLLQSAINVITSNSYQPFCSTLLGYTTPEVFTTITATSVVTVATTVPETQTTTLSPVVTSTTSIPSDTITVVDASTETITNTHTPALAKRETAPLSTPSLLTTFPGSIVTAACSAEATPVSIHSTITITNPEADTTTFTTTDGTFFETSTLPTQTVETTLTEGDTTTTTSATATATQTVDGTCETATLTDPAPADQCNFGGSSYTNSGERGFNSQFASVDACAVSCINDEQCESFVWTPGTPNDCFYFSGEIDSLSWSTSGSAVNFYYSRDCYTCTSVEVFSGP